MRDSRTKRATLATAHHEAGHAVVAWHLGVLLKHVSVVPDEDSAGRCHHASAFRGKYPELDDSPGTIVRMGKQIMLSLAGLIAQRLYSPRSVRNYHAHSDHKAAVDIALHLTGSEAEATALLKWLYIRTRAVLRLRWPVVKAVAQELMTRRSIEGEDVKRLAIETCNQPRD